MQTLDELDAWMALTGLARFNSSGHDDGMAAEFVDLFRQEVERRSATTEHAIDSADNVLHFRKRR